METTTPPTTVATQWPCHPRTVPRARHQLAELLGEWGLAHLAEDATLVLSELVSNAVKHGRIGRDVQTVFAREGDGVRIEVHDARGETTPTMTSSGRLLDDSGRGLPIVHAITGGQWGVAARTGPGKAVWAHVTPAEAS